MSDSDLEGGAWTVPPSRYLETRPPAHGIARPQSTYVTMRDGCRLAVDVYLPAGVRTALPCILILTPYYRRFALKAGAPEGSGGRAGRVPLARPVRAARLCARAWWTCAAPGRASARAIASARRANATTIARSPIGSLRKPGRTGASAPPASPMSARRATSSRAPGHPAVRAIAPLFAVWDTYSRPLLSRRHVAEPACAELRRADGRDGSRPARPAERLRLLQGPESRRPGAGRTATTANCGTPLCASIAATSVCRTSSPNSASAPSLFHTILRSPQPRSAPTITRPVSRRMSRFTPSPAGWTAPDTRTARSRASSRCRIASSICCLVRGIMGLASMSRHGGTMSPHNSR